MRVLVIWDQPDQQELMQLYLGVGGHDMSWLESPESVATLAANISFDVALMAITLPDAGRGFQVFEQLRSRLVGVPIVGACEPRDVFRIVRFMSHGMAAYILRDPNCDYFFMLVKVLEHAVDAARAAREQVLLLRLREEIKAVRSLQEAMIPRHITPPPGYRICGRYEPSQIQILGGRPVTMAGGDYYDVFHLDDNNVVLLVGDASGHGMKAAISIMVMHTLVRMISTHRYDDTAAFVREINNQLTRHSLINDGGGFITLLYAILRLDRHEVQWTSAGHPLPILQNLDSGEIRTLPESNPSGLPLAIQPESDYSSMITPLPRHSRLLLFTDGLSEAFPAAEPQPTFTPFGVPGIEQTLHKTAECSLEETLNSLFQESHQATHGTGRADDTSVVLIERL